MVFLIGCLFNTNKTEHSSVVRSYSSSKPQITSPMFWKDLKKFKQWKQTYFNQWMGTESTQFYLTFPDVIKSGNMKTYAGFWAHRLKKKKEKDFYISGYYEFIYYKFKGYDGKRSPKTYNFYRLKLNGDSPLDKKKKFYFLLRDIEYQQSNFDNNFLRGTIALGRSLYGKHTKKFKFLINAYLGVSGQTNINKYFPGITDINQSPHGFGETSGLEMQLKWHRLTAHLKHQIGILGDDMNLFNKTTIRLSISNLLFFKDYIWIQLDLELNKKLQFINGNLIYISYFYHF